MALKSINPTNDALLREYPEAPRGEVAAVLAAAASAFETWRRGPFAERAGGGPRCPPQLRRLRAPRRRPRGHALELPLVAGLPLCRPRAHGRQRRDPQA